MEAQRFPYDYDGILAGAPAFNRTHIHTVPVAQYRATHATRQAISRRPNSTWSIRRCWRNAAARMAAPLTDAFLTDPRACKFDPATLACPAGTDGPTCLNPDQVAAMKVYYAGSINLATGALINPGNARGSETSNPAALGLALNESLNEPSFDSLFKWVFGRPGSGRPSTSIAMSTWSIRCSPPISTRPARTCALRRQWRQAHPLCGMGRSADPVAELDQLFQRARRELWRHPLARPR